MKYVVIILISLIGCTTPKGRYPKELCYEKWDGVVVCKDRNIKNEKPK